MGSEPRTDAAEPAGLGKSHDAPRYRGVRAIEGHVRKLTSGR